LRRSPITIAVVAAALAGLALGGAAGSAHGERVADRRGDPDDDDLANMTLEELLAVEIVTASTMQEALSRAPGVVIRLSRRDLEARGYRELLDLFDDLPGMDVVRPWADNYLKAYWRGYRTDVTHPFLVMVDGLVVNSLWTGDASVLAALPITAVDHVEIVYGPASAVYGANAFMGVVHVITVAGAGDDDTRLRLRVTAGSHGLGGLDRRTVDGVVIHQRAGIRLTLAGRIALGFTDADAAERFEYTSSRYADDRALWGDYLDFENLARGARSPIDQYGVDARLRAGNLELGAFALALSTGYGLVYPTDRAQPHGRWIQSERSAHAAYRAELADGVTSHSLLRLRASGIDNPSYFLSGFDAPYPDEGDPARRVLELSYWQAQNHSAILHQRVEAHPLDELTVVAGGRYERKDLQGAYDVTTGPWLAPAEVDRDVPLPAPPARDLRSVERPQTDDVGVYAQARYRRTGLLSPRDGHALHLGARYDWSSVFGGAHSPTLRVGYVGERDSAHGLFLGKLLYGEGFHEPNPRQLYGQWLGSGSSPALRPERSRTFELNLSHTTDWLSNLISAYYVRNENTIVLFAGGAANEGQRHVAGFDYHLQALLRPPGVDTVSLWAFYSFIWSEELRFDAEDREVRGPIGDLAAHKAWLGATARRDRWTATLRSRAIGERETVATNPIARVRGYLIFDANLALERLGGTPVSLAVQGDNLLGTRYSHPGIRTADSGVSPGSWEGDTWLGSEGWYNSRLPQPGRRVMLTLGLDL
jgi:outer membrane receptor for ferrienterochelin and colicins